MTSPSKEATSFEELSKLEQALVAILIAVFALVITHVVSEEMESSHQSKLVFYDRNNFTEDFCKSLDLVKEKKSFNSDNTFNCLNISQEGELLRIRTFYFNKTMEVSQ